jgi:hypothetical protein
MHMYVNELQIVSDTTKSTARGGGGQLLEMMVLGCSCTRNVGSSESTTADPL